MNPPPTPEEHAALADASQLEGSVCALISFGMVLSGLGWAIAGHWEGLAAAAVGGWLLTIANKSYARADQHRSAAAHVEAQTWH